MYGGPIVGALIGWKRSPSKHGIVISFQMMTPDGASRDGGGVERVSLALNDRQLRSLARDLHRAAGERGIKLWARSTWPTLLFKRARSKWQTLFNKRKPRTARRSS